MSYLPQPLSAQRPARIRLAEFTPAVLRVEDGSCTSGGLEIFSLTGGLLSLPQTLNQGTRAKVMFLTDTGPVLGVAELLAPISGAEQPFRFLALQEGDRRRLSKAVQPAEKQQKAEAAETLQHPPLTQEQLAELTHEQQWIEKYRTAIEASGPPRKRTRWKTYATFTTAATIAAGIAYIVQTHWLK